MRWWGILALAVVTGCSAVKAPSPVSAPTTRRGDVEEGLASWYGPGFHGRRTANGEIYDQDEVSAAHKTLPLGSRVMVTNLDNDRSLEMRINDRGPFVEGRIIDLSRGAARELGVIGPGVVPVRVAVLEYGDNRYVKVWRRGMQASGTIGTPADVAPVRVARPEPAPPPAPAPTVVARTAPPPSRPVDLDPPAPVVRTAVRTAPPAPPEDRFTVQVAKLTSEDRAHHLAGVLRERFPTTRVNTTTAGEQRVFRVEIGPFVGRTVATAEAARVSRLGYPAVIAQAE